MWRCVIRFLDQVEWDVLSVRSSIERKTLAIYDPSHSRSGFREYPILDNRANICYILAP